MSKVSIIIPTLDEELHIDNILSDLKKQTIKPLEILVVDGKSIDKTQAITKKYPSVKLYVTQPNPAIQRTYGGKKAKGDLLIFLDADVRIKKNFIQFVLEQWKQKQFSIACPFYLPYKSTFVIASIYIFFDSMFLLWQKIAPSGAGSCIVVTKKIFSDVGGFDKSLRYDDIAFIRKAAKKNKYSILLTAVKVSDRRFRKEGVIKTTLRYLLLSFFFITNQFKRANAVPYEFDHYK